MHSGQPHAGTTGTPFSEMAFRTVGLGMHGGLGRERTALPAIRVEGSVGKPRATRPRDSVGGEEVRVGSVLRFPIRWVFRIWFDISP